MISAVQLISIVYTLALYFVISIKNQRRNSDLLLLLLTVSFQIIFVYGLQFLTSKFMDPSFSFSRLTSLFLYSLISTSILLVFMNNRVNRLNQILLIFVIAGSLSLLIELFVFNFDAFYYGQSLDVQELKLEDINPNDSVFIVSDREIVIEPIGGMIEFSNLEIDTRNISIYTRGTNRHSIGNLYVKDDARQYQYEKVNSFTYNPGSEFGYNVINLKLDSSGSLKALMIEFVEPGHPTTIQKIVLNSSVGININPIRLMILSIFFSLLYFIRDRNLYKLEYQPSFFWHRAIVFSVYFVMIIFVLIVSKWITTSTNNQYFNYPMTSDQLFKIQPYIQQLDAFIKGQLHFDVFIDPNLSKLKNVYDVSERAMMGINYLWDRVYFNGQYYSYFGILPIVIIYFPYYQFFNIIPSDLWVMTILSILSITGIFLAVLQITKHFITHRNFIVLVFGLIASVFGSLTFLVLSSPNFYYIAIQAMMFALSFYVFLVFKAISNTTKMQALYFFLAGIFAVFIVLSRPNVVLIAFGLTISSLIAYLLNNQNTIKTKIINVVAFVLPIVFSSIWIMYFNYSRFGSVFEFGSTFQLTAHDISENSINFSLFFDSIFAYFFQFPKIIKVFPFFEYLPIVNDSGRYLYQARSFGLFTLPMFWVLFPSLFIRNTSKELKSTTILTTISIILVGFINYNLAGIHIRYIPDIALGSSFIVMVSYLFLIQETTEKQIFIKIVLMILVLSIFIGFLTIFNNEVNTIFDSNADLFFRISGLFK